MAKRIFHTPNYTPTAQADTTALTNATYQAIKGGSSTQIITILEIYIAGLAAASSPTIMQFARHSTIATTPTAIAANSSDAPLHPSTTALANTVIPFTAAATGPQRSAATTDAKLELNLNAFGGIVRWVANPGAEFIMLGNAASSGESSLSAFTGGTVGAISSHIIYEPL